MLSRKLLAWVFRYLILTGCLSLFFALLLLVYVAFPTQLLGDFLWLFRISASLVLIGIGITSLLPLSEFAYTKQAGLNPKITKEYLKHRKKRQLEKRELGILLGIAGLTFLFGFDPFGIFLFFLPPEVTLSMFLGKTVLMAIVLSLFIIVYIRKLSKHLSASDISEPRTESQ